MVTIVFNNFGDKIKIQKFMQNKKKKEKKTNGLSFIFGIYK